MEKEYSLLSVSLLLIIIGLLIPMFDEAIYLDTKHKIQSDYFTAKAKLENDRILGLLPTRGTGSYYNQSSLLENDYKYKLENVELMKSTSSMRIYGERITSIGLWALPTSLIFLVIVNKELSEEHKLVLLIGTFLLFIFVAYGHTINFELSLKTGLG